MQLQPELGWTPKMLNTRNASVVATFLLMLSKATCPDGSALRISERRPEGSGTKNAASAKLGIT